MKVVDAPEEEEREILWRCWEECEALVSVAMKIE